MLRPLRHLAAVVCHTLTLLIAVERTAGQRPFQSIPGSLIQSNFTTEAVTVSQVEGVCRTGPPQFSVVEAKIADIHREFLARRLTCTQLVQAYTQRISDFDQKTGVNSVRALSPSLLEDAAALDQQLVKVLDGNPLPKLFCVALLVKDNYDTKGIATSNGAAGLLDNFPAKDAYQVQLLKNAGAIVLAKTNMAEWAFSPDISIGSAFGVVRNPYATDYSTAGSSGGTAAGITANFGLVGLGTDTGNSIRGPAGWNSLVGLRPSLGLSSRSGIVPLDLTSDVGGPLGRTVEDTVRVFEATVGVDPADNLTTLQRSFQVPDNYTQFLVAGNLNGMKIGVMRQVIDNSTADPAVMQLFDQALVDLKQAGATIVDNFTIRGNSLGGMDWDGGDVWYTGYGDNLKAEQLDCGARFRYDINNYLNASGSRFKTIQSLVSEGQYHPSANLSMTVRLQIPYLPSQYPPPQLAAQGYVCTCKDFYSDPCRMEFRTRLIQNMDAAGVSVLVYPTWSNPPVLIGDYGEIDGNNSPQISPPTGAPAIAVPMGFSAKSPLAPFLPASLQFLARPFDEGTLIKAAYAYEQATNKRRAPPAFPECRAAAAPGPARASSYSSAPIPSSISLG